MTAEKPEEISDTVNKVLDDIKKYAVALKAENDQREREKEKIHAQILEEFEQCIKEITDIVNSKELRYILEQTKCTLIFPDINPLEGPAYTYRLTSSGLVDIYSDSLDEKDIYMETPIADPVSVDHFRKTWIYAPSSVNRINRKYISNIEEMIRKIIFEYKKS